LILHVTNKFDLIAKTGWPGILFFEIFIYRVHLGSFSHIEADFSTPKKGQDSRDLGARVQGKNILLSFYPPVA